MLKALHDVPSFDERAFRRRVGNWKPLLAAAGPGADRVVVEWGVVRGPNCFVFPASDRAKGINLTQGFVGTQSDERWADFLEYTFVPQVVQALQAEGIRVHANCVDLRPVQTQRARRRVIDAAAKARSGAEH